MQRYGKISNSSTAHRETEEGEKSPKPPSGHKTGQTSFFFIFFSASPSQFSTTSLSIVLWSQSLFLRLLWRPQLLLPTDRPIHHFHSESLHFSTRWSGVCALVFHFLLVARPACLTSYFSCKSDQRHQASLYIQSQRISYHKVSIDRYFSGDIFFLPESWLRNGLTVWSLFFCPLEWFGQFNSPPPCFKLCPAELKLMRI